MIATAGPTEIALLALRIAVVLALYVFLFAVARVLRADLRAATLASAPAPADRLEVLECDGASELEGKLFAFAPGSSIGRGVDNDIALQEPRVSTRHARLLWREGRWWVEDLDSSNGTFVNDKRVAGLAALGYEDTLRLGPALLRLQRSREA